MVRYGLRTFDNGRNEGGVTDHQFSDRDHLVWSRFMLASVLAILNADNYGNSPRAEIRNRLSRAWEGLGPQGVEGAMLSMILTLESMGCRIKSTQTSPESSEIVVESMPGAEMLEGLEDRFDIEMSSENWRDLLGTDRDAADRTYDLLGAIADGAGVEFLRENTDEGDVRLVIRAW